MIYNTNINTVKDLIDELSKYDGNLEVQIQDAYYLAPINTVEVKEADGVKELIITPWI